MNQTQRLIEVSRNETIIGNADRELLQLRKLKGRGEAILKNRSIRADVRTKTILEMEELERRITAAADCRSQAHAYIQQLDSESARQAVVRTISETRDHAQIAITYERDNGKKISYTRHIHFDGMGWRGLSTVSSNRVIYRLPGLAILEAA